MAIAFTVLAIKNAMSSNVLAVQRLHEDLVVLLLAAAGAAVCLLCRAAGSG
jgi:hypothetical protein